MQPSSCCGMANAGIRRIAVQTAPTDILSPLSGAAVVQNGPQIVRRGNNHSPVKLIVTIDTRFRKWMWNKVVPY
jgi:hypothetical protein